MPNKELYRLSKFLLWCALWYCRIKYFWQRVTKPIRFGIRASGGIFFFLLIFPHDYLASGAAIGGGLCVALLTE
jgi:hypothetical protein